MLQIKNTLGGGKPEGLYVWKKYNYAFTEKSTSGMTVNTFITTEAQNKSIKYYYSSSYSYDDNTGMFVLENPTSGTVPYDAGISPPANVYVTVFSPSSEIMIKTSSTSGKSTLYNVSTGVYFHITNANYPYTLFESETILSFIDYIVSDKETAYPDGGEKGGYWYEKVSEGIDLEKLGCTKFEEGSVVLSSDSASMSLNHSLDVVPKFGLLYTDELPNSGVYVKNMSRVIRPSDGYDGYALFYGNASDGEYKYNYQGSGYTWTTTTAYFSCGSSQKFKSGITYNYVIFG